MKKPTGGAIQRRADKIDAFIGQRIRAARITAGLSQTELGEQIGVTFQQVQKYEKGVNRVGGGRMVRIGEALNRPVGWFSEGSSSHSTNNGKHAAADPLTRLGQTRDGVRLANAFNAIKDSAKRHAIVASAEAMAA
jgi:transcriptional regulator with XRE-family HTH domain